MINVCYDLLYFGISGETRMFKVLMKIKDNINIFIIVAIILLSGLLIGTPIIENNTRQNRCMYSYFNF